MKCSIITIHHIHNFGSVFQAYALAHYLDMNGYEAEIIDYRPGYYDYGRNKLKTYVGRMLNIASYYKRKAKFENFIAKHENLSNKRFGNLSELKEYYRDSDRIFIAGGDQLWNSYHPCGNDDAYKLVFSDGLKKIAYGTSMGRDNYSDEELKKIALLVDGFQKIMLREQSTVPLLQRHTRVSVKHVIDPVGLLDIKEFKSIAVKPKIDEPYAVMYLADSGEILNQAIEILSKKMGLKIVHICGFKKKCYCDYFIKDAGPEEILGYILHANFVLSASFHATMFSLMFQKQFATLLPGEQTNARINDLLEYVGLENRVLHCEEELIQIENPINYSKANQKLLNFREESRAALLSVISEITEG
jgi:hypothetical protein